MQGCLMGDTLWIVPPGRPIRDLLLLYVTAFLRALSTGLIGVLLGIYLAKFGFNAAQIGYVIRAGLAGGACATLLVTLAGNRSAGIGRWSCRGFRSSGRPRGGRGIHLLHNPCRGIPRNAQRDGPGSGGRARAGAGNPPRNDNGRKPDKGFRLEQHSPRRRR